MPASTDVLYDVHVPNCIIGACNILLVLMDSVVVLHIKKPDQSRNYIVLIKISADGSALQYTSLSAAVSFDLHFNLHYRSKSSETGQRKQKTFLLLMK